jgi:hypothetical protein
LKQPPRIASINRLLEKDWLWLLDVLGVGLTVGERRDLRRRDYINKQAY